MLKIDLAKARELLQAAIAEKGEDYVYEWSRCEYAHAAGTEQYRNGSVGAPVAITEDTAACGVGVALNKGGISVSDLLRCDSDARSALRQLWEAGLLDYTGAAATLLQEFQSHQDVRHTWGSALENAERNLARGVDYWDNNMVEQQKSDTNWRNGNA